MVKVPIYIYDPHVGYKPMANIELTVNSKIGYIRSTLDGFLKSLGLNLGDYIINMQINPSTKLNTFSTYDYDNFDLSSVWNNIKNSYIALILRSSLLESLPKDVIRKIGLELNPRDVINMCLSNKRLNSIICEDTNFWRNKIYIDFPTRIPFNIQHLSASASPKRLYEMISARSKIIELTSELYPELIDIREEWGNARFPVSLQRITNAIKNKMVTSPDF